jgi:thioredoxin reductase
LPPVPGLAGTWGHSVLHCPYCHGFEVADQPTGLWLGPANATHAALLVALLLNWTAHLTVLTDGRTLPDDVGRQLADWDVAVIGTPVESLEKTQHQLTAVRFVNGRRLPLRVLYSGFARVQATDLPTQLGCALDEQGLLRVDAAHQTTVPDVYAIGDNCTPLHQLAHAIGAGNRLGADLSRRLIVARRGLRWPP